MKKKELRQKLQELLADQSKAEELGHNARKTIIEKFNESLIVQMWDHVFRSAIDQVSCSLKE